MYVFSCDHQAGIITSPQRQGERKNWGRVVGGGSIEPCLRGVQLYVLVLIAAATASPSPAAAAAAATD